MKSVSHIFRRLSLFLPVAIFALLATPAFARQAEPFSAQDFAEAQAAGQMIVLHFNAFWCAACSVQRPILSDILDEIEQNEKLSDLTVFTVDFDSQADVVKRFNVRMQGTLIVFRGNTEMARVVGETDPTAIKSLLLQAKSSPAEQVRAALIAARLTTFGSYALGLLAGILSILSPCVLPLVPLVVGESVVAGRFSALALSSGVAISYVAIGLLVAIVGARSGLGTNNLRVFAAALMLLASVVLLSESLQQRFALVGGRIESAADRLIARVSPSGYGGQFVIGGLLGAVWSPCVGPTLAAAATLAAQRETLGQATVVMLLFGLGAALPLALVGTLSRKALGRWQSRMAMAGRAGKLLLGGVLALTSVAVITGLDRAAETYLLNVSPAWLTNMTIRF